MTIILKRGDIMKKKISEEQRLFKKLKKDTKKAKIKIQVKDK